MDRLVYYKKVLDKNPAYGKALSECMEELVKVPLFSEPENCENIKLKGSIIHYLHTWAPVLTEFAAWVLADAQRREIKRLYFLSRDAYPVYRAAQMIAGDANKCEADAEKTNTQKNKDFDADDTNRHEKELYPELKYLRVSRYALRIPEMAIDDSCFLDMMFLSGIDVTMRKILSRAALEEQEMNDFSNIIGFMDSFDRILSRPEILYWKGIANEYRDELWEIVKKHASEKLPNAIGYLKQEGMLSGEKIAIVDSGWVGTTQRSLQKLINYGGNNNKLSGYYFGLYEIPKDMDKKDYKTFYFGPGGQLRRKVYFSNCLFEAVSSESMGMTLGYEPDGDCGFTPVVAEYGSLNADYLNTMQPFLEMFAKAYVRNMGLDNGCPISEGILTKLMAMPDKWEAERYGTLQFCDDVLEGSAQDIATMLSYDDIRNLRIFRKTVIWIKGELHLRAPVIHESGWLYGSIVRRRKNVRWSLFQARLYNYLMYIRKGI